MKYILLTCMFMSCAYEVYAERIERNFIITVYEGLDKNLLEVYNPSADKMKMPFLNKTSQASYVFNSFYIEKDVQASLETLLKSKNRYNIEKNNVNVWQKISKDRGFGYKLAIEQVSNSCKLFKKDVHRFIEGQKGNPYILILHLSQSSKSKCHWSPYKADQFISQVYSFASSYQQQRSTALFVLGVQDIIGDGVFSSNSNYLIAEERSRRSSALLYINKALNRPVYKNDMIHLMDVFPTSISFMLGQAYQNKNDKIDGINMYDYVLSGVKKSPRTQFLYFNNQAKLYAIRFKDYKVWVNSKGIMKAYIDI